MKHTLTAVWRMNLNELWFLPALQTGLWLVMETVMWFALRYDPETTTAAPVANAVALYCGGLACLVFAVLRFSTEYNFYLQYSLRRRDLLIAQLVCQLGHALAGQAVLLLLVLLSGPLHRSLYGAAGNPWGPIPWWAWLLTLALPLLLGLFAGGVILRFGKAGWLVLYLLFMGLCFSSGPAAHWLETNLTRLLPLLPLLPVLLPAAALLPAAFGVFWLLRTPVQTL